MVQGEGTLPAAAEGTTVPSSQAPTYAINIPHRQSCVKHMDNHILSMQSMILFGFLVVAKNTRAYIVGFYGSG
jgi:hypothetical protein